MTPVELASIAAGSCIACWFAGYGFGRAHKTIIRLLIKGVR